MHVRRLHRWDLSPKDAVELQRQFRDRIENTEVIDPESLKLIAGVDVSSTRFDRILTAGVVVWEPYTKAIVEATFVQSESDFPYIPGLLSFREIPVLEKAISALTVKPDVVLVDGQGIAHPRGMGIAAHLGLLIDVPTIGVAKSILCGEHAALSEVAGGTVPLMFHGKQIGVVLRSKNNAKPLIISPGNGISMESAVAVVKRCLLGYRLPEPTRLAHLHVNAARKTGKGIAQLSFL